MWQTHQSISQFHLQDNGGSAFAGSSNFPLRGNKVRRSIKMLSCMQQAQNNHSTGHGLGGRRASRVVCQWCQNRTASCGLASSADGCLQPCIHFVIFQGTVSDKLFHITDWMPTLAALAGISTSRVSHFTAMSVLVSQLRVLSLRSTASTNSRACTKEAMLFGMKSC